MVKAIDSGSTRRAVAGVLKKSRKIPPSRRKFLPVANYTPHYSPSEPVNRFGRENGKAYGRGFRPNCFPRNLDKRDFEGNLPPIDVGRK